MLVRTATTTIITMNTDQISIVYSISKERQDWMGMVKWKCSALKSVCLYLQWVQTGLYVQTACMSRDQDFWKVIVTHFSFRCCKQMRVNKTKVLTKKLPCHDIMRTDKSLSFDNLRDIFPSMCPIHHIKRWSQQHNVVGIEREILPYQI